MSQLSENIKYLRTQAGASQKDFGKAFGVTRDNIASYERGSEPKLEFLQRLVNFYHMTMEEIVNSNLKDICENPEKLDLKIRPKLDLNPDPNKTNGSVALDPPSSFHSNATFDKMYKMQLERLEILSAENALLKRENDELRAENAKLKGVSKNYK